MKKAYKSLFFFLTVLAIYSCTEEAEAPRVNHEIAIEGIPSELTLRVGEKLYINYSVHSPDGLYRLQISDGKGQFFKRYAGEQLISGKYLLFEELAYYLFEEEPGEWYLNRDYFEVLFFASDIDGDDFYKTCKVQVIK